MCGVNPSELVTGNELVMLYALLHDAGKPIRRYLARYREGLEKQIQMLEIVKSLGLREGSIRKHDLISSDIIEIFLGVKPSIDVIREVNDIVKHVDPLSAIERGVEVSRESSGKVATEILNTMNELLIQQGIKGKYDPDHTPIITPLWLIKLAKYDTGPCAGEANNLWRNLVDSSLTQALRELSKGNVPGFLTEFRRLVIQEDLFNSKLWLPIFPLRWLTIREDLRLLTYAEAQGLIKYGEVTQDFLEGLLAIKKMYDVKGTQDLGVDIIDTLLALLFRSFFLVPSAVYGTLLPDISLYAHSKYVTALAQAKLVGNGNFRILSVDINGIQRFISSVTSPSAASRILRGRSLLVELLQDAIVRYTLELFGKLSEAAVLTSEGGTVSLIVPDSQDFESKVKKLKHVLLRLTTGLLKHELGFTIGWSRLFNEEDCKYMSALLGKRSFTDVLRDLGYTLARNKALRGTEEYLEVVSSNADGIPMLIHERDIAGFDFSSKASIGKTELSNLALCVTKDNKEYVNILAPEKIAEGDCLDQVTHLALVAGSATRNLVSVISVHAYSNDKDNYAEPSDAITEICKAFFERITRKYSVKPARQTGKELLIEVKIPEAKVKTIIATIPLKELGSMYILISWTSQEPVDPNDKAMWGGIWSALQAVIEELSNALLEVTDTEWSNLNVTARIKVVNALDYFLPQSISEDIHRYVSERIVRKLRSKGVGISFGFLFTNTYHPVTVEDDEVRLKSLDSYDLVALAKVDGDRLGHVKEIISTSPSRLIMFSELLNIGFGAKSYSLTLKKPRSNNTTTIRDAIVLYGGGDDVAIYGEWKDVILLVDKIMLDVVKNLLSPLTASAGITISKPKEPIVDTYSTTVNEYLEKEAKKVRNAVSISLAHPMVIPCLREALNVIPPNSNSWGRDERVGLKEIATLLREIKEGRNPLNGVSDRLIYTLTRLSIDASRTLKKTSPRTKAKILVAYARLWAQRKEEMETLLSKLSKYKITLPKVPTEDQETTAEKILELLAGTATLLNTYILAKMKSQPT